MAGKIHKHASHVVRNLRGIGVENLEEGAELLVDQETHELLCPASNKQLSQPSPVCQAEISSAEDRFDVNPVICLPRVGDQRSLFALSQVRERVFAMLSRIPEC